VLHQPDIYQALWGALSGNLKTSLLTVNPCLAGYCVLCTGAARPRSTDTYLVTFFIFSKVTARNQITVGIISITISRQTYMCTQGNYMVTMTTFYLPTVPYTSPRQRHAPLQKHALQDTWARTTYSYPSQHILPLRACSRGAWTCPGPQVAPPLLRTSAPA
jgi:hypothetical protein